MNTLAEPYSTNIPNGLIIFSDDAMLLPKFRRESQMSEITLNLGPISIPENRIWKAICWIPRKLAGTQMLCDQLKGVTNHVSAMTDILHIVIADLTAKWPQEKRERVQRHIANFRIRLRSIIIPGQNGLHILIWLHSMIRFHTDYS